MRSLESRLAAHPKAWERVQKLIALHDVWVVGGTARWMLYESIAASSDIDLLVNTTVPHDPLTAKPVVDNTGSGGQGQKETIDGVKLDIFENDIFQRLKGVPLIGDGLAVRAKDGFVLGTKDAFTPPLWDQVSPNYANLRPSYLVTHSESLRRDRDAIFRGRVD